MSRGLAVALLAAGAISLATPAIRAEPDASTGKPTEGERAWLANPGGTESAVAASGNAPPWRFGVALLFLGALGATALYLRRKKRTPGTEVDRHIEVIDSAAVGPKARAVVAQVAGRKLLLGVTESSVQRLAWLDEAVAEREDDAVPVRRRRDNVYSFHELLDEPDPPVPANDPPVPANDAPAALPPKRPSRFREILRGVMRRSSEPAGTSTSDAALQLAGETEDVVRSGAADRPASRTRASEPRNVVRIEEQAAGLAARLAQRKAANGR